jgi:hypothetical protein
MDDDLKKALERLAAIQETIEQQLDGIQNALLLFKRKQEEVENVVKNTTVDILVLELQMERLRESMDVPPLPLPEQPPASFLSTPASPLLARLVDRNNIYLHNAHEVHYWTLALDCTEQQLRSAVAVVGANAEAVRRYLCA